MNTLITTSLSLAISLALSLALWSCDEGTSTSQEEVRDLRESVAGDEPEADLAPEWDETARAWIEAASEESFVLHWSAAHDDHRVIGYRIERDDVLIAELDGEQTSLTISPMPNIESYTFQIIAGDAAHQWTRGPSTVYTVEDSSPPTWPTGAMMIASPLNAEGMTITWPHAMDNVAVTRYLFANNGAEPLVMEGNRSAVLILEPEQEYTFQVWAEDAAANQSDPLNITLNAPLERSAPIWPDESTLEVLGAQSTSVDLQWTAATDDMGIERYIIYRDLVPILTISGTELRGSVDSLAPNTSYRLTIVAEDAQGNRASGPSVDARTVDNAPPSWPEDTELMASNLTPHALTLGWTPAVDDTGVHHYLIVREGFDDQVVQGTSIEIESLSPWTEYAFSVVAVDTSNNRSTEPLSLTVRTSDTSPPSWPDGALHATVEDAHVIQLTWDAAMDDVAVVGYRIWLDDIEIASVNTEVQAYRMEDLSPWTEYALTVDAFDAAGNSSSGSPSVRARTLDTVRPTWSSEDRLEISELTPTSLRLVWPSPRDDVGIDQMMIYRDGELLESLPRGITQYVVQGLTPWTNYLFEVRALDIAGNQTSENLTASVRTFDSQRPIWESGARLRATEVNETTCALQWGAAHDDVEVAYQLSQDGETLITVNADTTEYLVEGLSPRTWYDFQVQAVDPAGNHAVPNLSLRIRTPDNTTPTWPENAELSYSDLGESSLTLHWPTAHDDFAIHYELYRDGALDEVFSDGETMFDVEGLIASTDYYFHVVAIDSAGNPSRPLGVHIQTDDQPVWRPELAAQDLNRKMLITFHVPGAWDPSSTFDPKGYTTESTEIRINQYHESEIQRPSYNSPIRWAPSAANQSFFEEFGERLLIINGVDVGSNLTKSALRSVGGGHLVQRYPSIGALHAAINAPEAPLAFISHGGYEETAGQVSVSRLSGQHLWRSIASPNDHGSTVNAYLHGDEFNRANRLVTRRVQRRLENTRLPSQRAVLEKMVSASQVGGLEYFTQYDDGGSRNGALSPRLHSGLVAFKAGLTAALNLKFSYSFSTPEGEYDRTAWKFEVLWSALRTIWTLVEQQGLEDQVIVMVVCPLGRTALNGPNGNKQRWPITSVLFFGAGVEGNRVIGGTDHRMMPRPIDAETLQVVEGAGVVLTTAHIHAALRELLGISDDPLANKYPLNVPILPIFD